MNPRRLAQNGTITAPRPLLIGAFARIAARLQSAAFGWFVWSAWCFAAGLLIGLEIR